MLRGGMSIQRERATKEGKLLLGPVSIKFNIIQHRIPTDRHRAEANVLGIREK